MTTLKQDPASEYFFSLHKSVNDELERLMPFSTSKILDEAMRYALFPGGKRLRPILAILSGEIFSGRSKALLSIAASVEMLHAASLVLDDLPAMDNAQARHGRPSHHLVHDAALSVLCGHSLVSLALYLPTRSGLSDRACRIITAELSGCIGPIGMAASQADDLLGNASSEQEAVKVAYGKTGYLFASAAFCGAAACGAPSEQSEILRSFGFHLGVAFQIADDISDQHAEDLSRSCVNVANVVGRKRAVEILHNELGMAEEKAGSIGGAGSLFVLTGRVRKNVSNVH